MPETLDPELLAHLDELARQSPTVVTVPLAR
jgi:hypothetical protein